MYLQVKVTEIFDVTDSDSPIVQTRQERDINENLEFDDDWEESTWTNQHVEGGKFKLSFFTKQNILN